MDVKGRISAQQRFSDLQVVRLFFLFLFLFFWVFPVHIIHTAVNSLEGIQKTRMYLVQNNLQGHLSEAIVIPEEKTTFLNYDICKIAGVYDQVTTESSKPFCLPHQLVSFVPHAWSTAFPTHPFPVQSGFTPNPNGVLTSTHPEIDQIQHFSLID